MYICLKLKQSIPVKKILLFIFICILSSSNIFADKQIKIDSLKNVLETVEGEKKVQVLIKLSELNLLNFPAVAVEYAKQALNLAKLIKYETGELEALAKAGVSNHYLGNYEKALKYYNQLLDIYRKKGDKKYIAGYLNNIGACYYKLGNYDKALENYHESLKIREELEDKKGIASSLNNIGNIYDDLSKYNKALEYYSRSLTIKERLNDKKGMESTLNNIGIIYNKLGKYDKALDYHHRSLKIKNEIGNKKGIAIALYNIGKVYEEKDNYNDALKYFQQALQYKEGAGDKWGISNTCLSIGSIYLKIKNYSLAFQYIKKGLDIAIEIGAKELIKDGYEKLSKYYSLNKNYEKALEYYELYAIVKDSIFNEKSNKTISELQTKYESEKKEQEIKIQKTLISKKNHQLLMSIVLGGIIIIMAILFIFFLYKTKKQKEKILKHEAENLKKELELKNRELVCNVSNIYVKNQVINKVARKLSTSSGDFKSENIGMIRDIIGELKQNLDETSWKEFEIRFARVHETFYKNLDKAVPDLTNNERKLCAMLKLNMSSKEIAAITMTLPESIDTARSRLRKKIGLLKDENFSEFLNKL